MNLRKKMMLWLGLVFSLPAAGYAAISVVYYAWLNAADPDRWPNEKAAIWVIGALVLTIAFSILFIYCLIALIKEANRSYREEQKGS